MNRKRIFSVCTILSLILLPLNAQGFLGVNNPENLWGKSITAKPGQGYVCGNFRYNEPTKKKPFDDTPPLWEWFFVLTLTSTDSNNSYFVDLKRPDGNVLAALPAGNYEVNSLGISYSVYHTIHFPLKKYMIKVREDRVTYLGEYFYSIGSDFEKIWNNIEFKLEPEFTDNTAKVRTALEKMGMPESMIFVQHFQGQAAQRL